MRTTNVLACTTYCNTLGSTNLVPIAGIPNKPRSIDIYPCTEWSFAVSVKLIK